MSRSFEPMTTSPLVPMSTSTRTPSLSKMRVASIAATVSAPTNPATMGRKAHHRVRGPLQRQLAGGNDQRFADHRRVRGQTDVAHVDAEEDVVHAGVAGDHDLVDVSRERRPLPGRPP